LAGSITVFYNITTIEKGRNELTELKECKELSEEDENDEDLTAKEMKDIKSEAFNQLSAFLYGMEIKTEEMSGNTAVDLLKAARNMQLSCWNR